MVSAIADDPQHIRDWFEERTPQIEIRKHKFGTIVAFGIPISSRWNEAIETAELIRFAYECAKRKVAHFVDYAFYDSKACICSFELSPAVRIGDPVADLILEAAKHSIGQFSWVDGHYYSECPGCGKMDCDGCRVQEQAN